LLTEIKGRFTEALKGELPGDPEVPPEQERRMMLGDFIADETTNNKERVENDDIGPDFALSEAFMSAAIGERSESLVREVSSLITKGEDPTELPDLEAQKVVARGSFDTADAWMRIYEGRPTADDAQLAYRKVESIREELTERDEQVAEANKLIAFSKAQFTEVFGFALPYQRLEMGKDLSRLEPFSDEFEALRKQMNKDRGLDYHQKYEKYVDEVQRLFEQHAPSEEARDEITADFEKAKQRDAARRIKPKGQDPLGERTGRRPEDRLDFQTRSTDDAIDRARQRRERDARQRPDRGSRSR
jgi:hypothetical protein